MSRRDSKVSLNNRQNDALTEFENFKKKFLLANKHITKLNSTLSVRIEELQAQISTLYVENLRLRASEIALAAQLKKEQEKSRKILADTEAATSNLSKHLGFLRQSFGISSGASPKLESKPASKARRPVVDPNASSVVPRLSRAPNIPGINEDDEVTSEEELRVKGPLAVVSATRWTAREGIPASTSPLPIRVASPPPLPMPIHVNLVQTDASFKRKGRRQNSLLSVNTGITTAQRGEGLVPPRAASPAFGSPIRREAGLAEDDEERRVESMLDPELALEALDPLVKPRTEKMEKKKSRHLEREATPEDTDGASSSRTKEKRRREEHSGLKDVTNSPRRRAVLPPLDTNTSDRGRQYTPDNEGPTPPSAASATTSRTFLTTTKTTPATTPQVSQLPTPRSSSPIPPVTAPLSEPEILTNGRERRARKSVNYAEPKLNTKMRKPDPLPPDPATSAPQWQTSTRDDEAESRLSTDVLLFNGPAPKPPSSSSSSSSIRHKKSRPYIPVDEDEEDSDGAQADAEYGYSSANWVNVDSRRRSAQSSGTSGSNPRRALEVDDARRHSFAV